MDPQMIHTHGQHYDENPLHPVGGEEEHHEKTSVMKKVKARARKIKHSLGIKSHSHEHDHDHDHDEEEEDDDDEEEDSPQEPAVHGAPIYDSAAAKNFATAQGVNPGDLKSHSGDNQEQNVCPGTFQTKVTDPDLPPPAAPLYDSPPSRNPPTDFAATHDSYSGQPKISLGEHLGEHLGEDLNAPKHGSENVSPANFQAKVADPGLGYDSISGQPKISLGEHLGEHLGGDLNAPNHGSEDVSPSNYQAKVADPGLGRGEEAGVTPILHSFDKMNIHDEPQQREKELSTTTGSHDQFTPSQGPSSVPNIPTTIPENAPSFLENKMDTYDEPQLPKKESPSFVSDIPIPENKTPPVPQSFDASTKNHPQDMNVDAPAPATQQSGYTDRISSVTSALADKAISAKNVVASKMGYGGNEAGVQKDNAGETVNESAQHPSTQQTTYTEKLSSAALSAKNAVASKLGYGGTDTSAAVEQRENTGEEGAKAGGGVTGYGKQMASTVAGVGSAVLSKLPGTGAQKDTHDTAAVGQGENRGDDVKTGGGGEGAKTGGGVTGYGKQIASTVTGKLAPVYGSVAGVGSAVLSKVPGTGAQKDMGADAPREAGSGVIGETDKGGVVGETDKGVVSMKGYMAEKMKPGEEDKALSEIISDALLMRKGGEEKHEKRPVGEVVSDAFHKRNDDDEDKAGYNENKPMGKVTESDEVANRLGSSESERLGKVSGSESPGTGVVDKFKGAFTNWFGKGGETNPSQAFNDNAPSHGTEEQGMPREGGETVSSEGQGKLH